MSLLHILQEGACVPADAFFHTHPTCTDSQISLPLNYSSPLHNILAHYHDEKQQLVTSMHHTEVAFLRGYTRPCVHAYNSESSVTQLQSPCKRSNEAPQLSTSSATSEPSSTLETTEATEIVAQNQQTHHLNSGSRWQISHAVGFRCEDGAQHSSQTSLDEGSSIQISMQESLASAHRVSLGEDTCPTAALRARVPIEESCSLDNYPTCEVRNRDASGVIASRATKKRKRTRICKNSEEVESQRMTHIAVERNRRKQMNEHLSVLRSLMPATYIQRGDQASIIGGAINFVKELEQVVEALQIKKRRRDCEDNISLRSHGSGLILENLMLKQQSTHYTRWSTKCSYMVDTPKDICAHLTGGGVDVEVKLSGSHALVKVLAQKLPHQLFKASLSLERLHLKIMHLNITTIEQSVLYSFNLEIQGDSHILTANDVAQSIQNIFKQER